MFIAPEIQPSGIEFSIDQRTIGSVLTLITERLVHIGAGAKVDCCVSAFDRSTLQVAQAVAI